MTLENRQLLAIQFVISLVAWASIASVFFAPRLACIDPRRALRAWIAPQMFRVIGMTLLAKNVVGAGLDRDFAEAVALGDFTTSVLAIVTFVALSRPGRVPLVLAAITTIVGAGDLLRNLVVGMRANAANDIGVGWFIVSMLVPLMLVAHVGAGFAIRAVRRSSS